MHLAVPMPEQLIVDDRLAAIRLAKRGLGLAFVGEMEVAEEIERSELELMFEEFIRRDAGLFLYFPAAMQSQPKLRAIIDLAKTLTTTTKARRPRGGRLAS